MADQQKVMLTRDTYNYLVTVRDKTKIPMIHLLTAAVELLKKEMEEK